MLKSVAKVQLFSGFNAITRTHILKIMYKTYYLLIYIKKPLHTRHLFVHDL